MLPEPVPVLKAPGESRPFPRGWLTREGGEAVGLCPHSKPCVVCGRNVAPFQTSL